MLVLGTRDVDLVHFGPMCNVCLRDMDLVLIWPSKDGWSSSISID